MLRKKNRKGKKIKDDFRGFLSNVRLIFTDRLPSEYKVTRSFDSKSLQNHSV